MAALMSGSARLRLPGAGTRLGRWAALYLQDRRRRRAGGSVVVPPPAITNGFSDWGRTENGWADVILDWTFDAGTLPVGVFELWWMREAVDPDFSLVATIPSNQREYYHVMVTQTPVFAYYRLRYRNGSVFGPFSDDYGVDV